MHWFEDEEFWREMYPYMFPAERIAASAEQVGQALALAGLQAGAVLDLCCGPGRHSVEFAKRGFAVTGVDKSPFLLERARERAAESAVRVEWIHQDMRDFRRPDAFDLACNLYTSFGYFEAEDDDLRVLRNLHASLKSGGALVMEMIGKERLARVWKDSFCTDYPDGATVVGRPRLRDDCNRVENDWTLIKDGHARTFHFVHSLYSGRELRDRLRAAGFAEVRLFGDLAGAPFDLDAPRLVTVARK